ncbi:hypothetical protein MNBD_UNCLBAC01-1684 [hydrothermal vent metagenome]|uniref:DUF2283 domain-containing protein n=2 Tax=hydrothermal vent metagenome TaxID=652676 RepID=A0A3B1CX49_9ZZZZ
MKLTFDPKYNVAYIRFHEKMEDVQTLHISDELMVDMSPSGKIYGIELLNAKDQLISEDMGKLLVVNEESGVKNEMSFN